MIVLYFFGVWRKRSNLFDSHSNMLVCLSCMWNRDSLDLTFYFSQTFQTSAGVHTVTLKIGKFLQLTMRHQLSS